MRLLFVCLGNICRSPTAEVVFRDLAAQETPALEFVADSAGTAAYHIGASPDRRTQAAALRRGYDLSALRARLVTLEDFASFDLILAVDRSTRSILMERAPREFQHRVRLLLEFAPKLNLQDVPDPYYGGPNGFEQVLDLAEAAARGLISHLKSAPRTP